MDDVLKQFSNEVAAKLKTALASASVEEFVKKVKASGDDRSFEVVMSTSDEDRQGDSLDQSRWDLKYYTMNPVVLWAHDYSSIPIGIVTDIEIQGNKSVAKGKFAPQGVNPQADTICALYQAKVVRAVSPGYIQNDDGTRELLELSFCPVPAGRYALSLRQVSQLGLSTRDLVTKGFFYETKGAVPYHDYGEADPDEAWDGPAQVKECGDDIEKLKSICAWFDAEDPDVKSSYKLPHHRASDRKAVWKGVVAAGSVLQGGRGGASLPEKDVAAVKAHLEHHYHDFGKKAPWEEEGKAYCLECGGEYHVKPSRVSKTSYCSRSCYAAAQTRKVGEEHPRFDKGIERTCKNCGEAFWIKKWRLNPTNEIASRGTFCSRECKDEFDRGENHHSYKGSYNYSEREKFHNSSEWKAVRLAVFARDGFKCWMCQESADILHAHHIREYAKYPDQRLDSTNLVTLCNECHKTMHKGVEFWTVMGVTPNTEPTLRMPAVDLFGSPPEEKSAKSPQIGDRCELDDGTPGVLADDDKNPGTLVCVPSKSTKSESMDKDLEKKIKAEHERHGKAIAKHIDEFEKKAVRDHEEPDGDEEKMYAEHKKAIDEFEKALDDEHEEHLEKCMKAIDEEYELQDQTPKKSIDEFKSEMKAEHLKHVKAMDSHVTAMKKDWPDGDPKEPEVREGAKKAIEEFTKSAHEELERHEKAHEDILKAHEDERDSEEDYRADSDEEKALMEAIKKSGRAISRKNKEKLKAILEKMESHHNDVTAALKELIGSEDGDGGEEPSEKPEGEKPAGEKALNSRSSTSGASAELEAYLLTQRLARQIKSASEGALRQINEKIKRARSSGR